MTDKFLFIEDLKGINGTIAQENAFEELEAILDEEMECEMCDEKDAYIDQLENEIEGLTNKTEKLESEIRLLKAGYSIVK